METSSARQEGDDAAAKHLLDQAQAAAEGGDNTLARMLLQKVVLQHPGTRAAEVARKTLGSVRGGEVTAVRVIDVDVSFVSMVWLFVKAAFAAIPAAIIVAVVVYVFLGALGGIA